MTGLRRDAGPDAYLVSGTLEGIDGPGRRTVRELTIRGLKADSESELSVLAGFSDLEHLTLEDLADIDLRPLAQTTIRGLRMLDVRGLDLAALAGLDRLEGLAITDFAECAIPSKLRLAASLEGLTIFNDASGLSGRPVADLIERIDWSRLGRLRTLLLGVGGNHELPPVGVDLNFLSELPELRTLRIEEGIVHTGLGPSPLEPPFAGLSRNLTWVRIDAVDPQPLQAALEAIMAPPAPGDPGPHGVSVYERPVGDRHPPRREWEVRAYDDEGWGAYGSLHQSLADVDEHDTEYDAAERAQARLRRMDSTLAARVDFDPEAAGTGIYAASREDVEAALRTLGIEPTR